MVWGFSVGSFCCFPSDYYSEELPADTRPDEDETGFKTETTIELNLERSEGANGPVPDPSVKVKSS